jgi:four helix bundle protein
MGKCLLKQAQILFDRLNKKAYDISMKIYKLTYDYPKDEKYSLTDQIRRSSRSVCSNIAEAWAKKLYPKHFRSKLTDSFGEEH